MNVEKLCIPEKAVTVMVRLINVNLAFLPEVTPEALDPCFGIVSNNFCFLTFLFSFYLPNISLLPQYLRCRHKHSAGNRLIKTLF